MAWIIALVLLAAVLGVGAALEVTLWVLFLGMAAVVLVVTAGARVAQR
jgi:hypothetical protein